MELIQRKMLIDERRMEGPREGERHTDYLNRPRDLRLLFFILPFLTYLSISGRSLHRPATSSVAGDLLEPPPFVGPFGICCLANRQFT